jgi:hypothetical protein
MKLRKLSVVLLALLLAAMAMVPMVSADDEQMQSSANKQEIIVLFEPVKADIEHQMEAVVSIDGLGKDRFDFPGFSKELVVRYNDNLNKIVKSLENEKGVELSAEDRENLKQIIVQEHMEKVSWAQFKKKSGVNDEDFKSLNTIERDGSSPAGNKQILSTVSLTLVQVTVDRYGGSGFDGGMRPYDVNGYNDLFDVTASTASGKVLYQCYFEDEDAPVPGTDQLYDEFRLDEYGTLVDIQGFFIRDPDGSGQRYIEFGNDWDNGYTYGTLIGQHGVKTLAWSTGTPIFISNVWNHAMGLQDRNSNMAKSNFYYF